MKWIRFVFVGLALTGCAAKSAYVQAPEKPDNLNAAIAGVGLDAQPDGSCTVSLAIKGAGIGTIDDEMLSRVGRARIRQWCRDAKISLLAAALVPKPAEVAK